jgi:tetratricopeptide (TPR) repeat protein
LNARRSQAELLANSSVALRNLHRNSEAVQRIESALAILEETKDLPADHISLDGVSYVVLCAQADQQDYEAHSHQAIASYRELLKKLELSTSNPRTDLRAAMKLSRLYQYLADLYARVGDAAQAKSFATQRLELWREWERKLPGNSFVTRQLTDQVLPASRAT